MSSGKCAPAMTLLNPVKKANANKTGPINGFSPRLKQTIDITADDEAWLLGRDDDFPHDIRGVMFKTAPGLGAFKTFRNVYDKTIQQNGIIIYAGSFL